MEDATNHTPTASPIPTGEVDEHGELCFTWETTLLRYFAYQHLPAHLQTISKPFHDLAHLMWRSASTSDADMPEMEMALRKLLEAKDAAVRSMVPR